MDETEIRRATVSDVDGFAASNAALFAEDGAARDHLRNPDWPGGHGARWCTDLIAPPAALVLVAVSAGDVVGHLVATFAEPSDMWVEPRAELVSMHVSSVWRAQGLGSRLVEEFVSWARGPVRLGCWSVRTTPTKAPSGSTAATASRRSPRSCPSISEAEWA